MISYLIAAVLVFLVINRDISKNPELYTNYFTVGKCRLVAILCALLWPGVIAWWVYVIILWNNNNE